MDRILDEKPKYISPYTGEESIDLTYRVYPFGIESLPIYEYGYVNSQFEMRSDLFAYFYANNELDEFEILKFNRISNPFSIKNGDILALPDYNTLSNFRNSYSAKNESKSKKDRKENIFKEVINSLKPTVSKENRKTNTFEDFKKLYENAKDVNDYNKYKNLQNKLSKGVSTPNVNSDLLPPNFSSKGDEVKVLPNGTIILGSSVADSDASCGKTNTSKAELLNSLIKNRTIR